MPRESLYLRSVALKGLPQFIKKLGGDPKALFSQVGLSLRDIRDGDNYVSWAKACDLLELAAKELNEPVFGIKWAQELPDDFQNSGPVAFIANIVPDIRGFMELAERYQKIQSNGFVPTYTDDVAAGVARWTIHMHPHTPSCRQYAEHIMAVIGQMAARNMSDVTFTSISFQHSALLDKAVYEEAYNCPVTFNANKLEITADRAYLERRIGGSLSAFRPLLNMYLDRRKRKVSGLKAPMKSRVEEILPSIFGAGKSDPVSVAKALGLSSKKLQRLLKDEGTHFSDIRDHVRHDMAKRLLLESDISITHLAHLLDYASCEAFNTACKRWCGLSPRNYRQALRSSKR